MWMLVLGGFRCYFGFWSISGAVISWGCCNTLRGVCVWASCRVVVGCSGFDCFWARLGGGSGFVMLFGF